MKERLARIIAREVNGAESLWRDRLRVVELLLDEIQPTEAMAITLLDGPRIDNYSDVKDAKVILRRVLKSLRTGNSVNRRYPFYEKIRAAKD